MFFSQVSFANFDGYHIHTVVIDAGHGGKDPGAIGKKSYEKDIVLNIALQLGEYIDKFLPEVKVVYTRDCDKFVPLDQRSDIANKNNADLFISIHANANRNEQIYGTETYTLGLHKTQENLEVAMKENSVMLYEEDYSTKYEGFDPNNPASYIIFNLMQGINREKSINLAEFTEYQFKNRSGRHSRGVREAGFWVLKQVSMPSILVEVGFISNPKEEKFLNTKTGQEYLASAIFRAFRDYKKRVETNSNFIARKTEHQQTESVSANTDTISENSNKTDSLENKPSTSPQQQTETTKATPVPYQVEYCVQIRSSQKKIPLSASIFNGLGAVSERLVNGVYKYTIGSTSDYQEILETQQEIRKKIKDCFVVAFYKGERISISQAKKIQKT